MNVTAAPELTQPHTDAETVASQTNASVFVGMTDVDGELMAEYALSFAL